MSTIAVFLDRDGTINEEMGYINHVSRFVLLPRTAAAIRRMNAAGLKVVVITNQSGAARGYFAPALVDEVHAQLTQVLAGEGAHVDAIYACLHGPDEGCACRKPRPGLLDAAAAHYGAPVAGSFLIGDKESDLRLARSRGCEPLLVQSGYGRLTAERLAASGAEVTQFEDLGAAARWILDERR